MVADIGAMRDGTTCDKLIKNERALTHIEANKNNATAQVQYGWSRNGRREYVITFWEDGERERLSDRDDNARTFNR